MKEEKAQFKDKNDHKLVGVLHIPDGKGPFPTVILMHGLWSNKDRPSYTKVAEALCSEGILTFRFDMFAHGESDGQIEEITLSTGVESLKAAQEFIETKDFIDKSKIGFFGASYGGAIAISGFNDNVKVIVLKCPASNYRETREIQLGEEGLKKWKEQGWAIIKGRKLNYSFYEDLLKNHNQYEEAERITVPTLIIHGDADKTVPIEQSKELFKHLKNIKELKIISGADHKIREPKDFNKVIELSLEWFKKYLK